MQGKAKGIFSGNALKIVAAVSMLIDHFGMIFFPHTALFRILGRLAFPLFAFFIAEGCYYTRNKLRYFLTVFLLGVAFQAVYYFVEKTEYYGILLTFSLSIVTCYALQAFKNALFSTKGTALKRVLTGLGFAVCVAGVYALNRFFVIDYGFFGCMAPVFVTLAYPPKEGAAWWEKRLTNNLVKSVLLGLSLVGLAFFNTGAMSVQGYALCALTLILLYSGERGRWKMKYFFYIFYPLHLVILYGVAFFIQYF